MRAFQCLSVAAAVLLALPAKAQETTITVSEVYVYSGPSTKFYPTSALRAGQKVEVVQTADNQPGWLAIKPPVKSFSWIAQRFVAPTANAMIGVVEADHDVPVLPGSSLTNQPPNVERAKLRRGTLVTIVGPPEYASTGVWLPIAPPAGEVRYIEAYAVKAPNVAAAGAPPSAPPGPAATPPQPGDPRNMAAPPQYAGGWQAGDQPRTPGQTTAYTKTTPTSPAIPSPPVGQAQYSPQGILRKTAFQLNGQPVYVLEVAAGQRGIYVAAPPGFTLSPYVGRSIRVYGTTSYLSNDYLRDYYVTATHVALY
jgi:hypothetical protein